MKINKRYLLKDEKIAPTNYYKFLKHIKNPVKRSVIMSIIKDEKRHYRMLKSL